MDENTLRAIQVVMSGYANAASSAATAPIFQAAFKDVKKSRVRAFKTKSLAIAIPTFFFILLAQPLVAVVQFFAHFALVFSK